MSGFATCSSRTKRRKLAAAVKEFKFMLDTISSPDTDSELDSGGYFNSNMLTESDCPECTMALDPADLERNVHLDSCDTATNRDQGANYLGWSPAREQAFEEELEACKNVVQIENTYDEIDPSVSKEDLRNWAIKHNINHAALYDLLHLLRRQNKHLPKDPRTLLATPVDIPVESIAGGCYYYFGVQRSLSDLVSRLARIDGWDGVDELEMHINVDGIPLFKSAKATLWPILARFPKISPSPVPIALFCGPGKPTSMEEFLKDFVCEMTNGCFKLLDRNVTIKLDAVICDAPARAMIKLCKGHTSYHCCERCLQKGQWNNKITFSTDKARLRTDEDFRLQTDSAHHIGTSPLASLPFGLVSQVPLDYMHVLCLGVMRRIVLLWSSGPTSCRMSHALLKAVSDRLITYRPFMPRQFARKPRALSEVKMWKATEFRTLLLYTGPVALKGLLSHKLYQNFMCLSVAITICLRPTICQQYSDYCEQLLSFFVQQFAKLYGHSQVVYNVHCLTHLADDVRRYGCLDNISAFPFENYLGHLKGLVRKGTNPVGQLVSRLAEGDKSFNCRNARVTDGNPCKQAHFNGPVPCGMADMEQYKQYVTEKLFLSCDTGDNCVEIGNKVGIVQNILCKADGFGHSCVIVFSPFEHKQALYEKPLLSEHLGIFSLSKLSESCTVYSVDDITRKCMLLPLPGETGFASFPL